MIRYVLSEAAAGASVVLFVSTLLMWAAILEQGDIRAVFSAVLF